MARGARCCLLARLALLALVSPLFLVLLPGVAVAAAMTRTVTNCGPSGSGSLTQAVADANTSSGDTIVFGLDCTGIVAGTSTTAGKIVPSATLTLTQDMTVDATGHTIVVDGNNAQSVFAVNSGATVMLKGLAIQHGNGVRGGGVDNESGALTVINCTLSGNTADSGGGINTFGPLTVTNSVLSGNSASGFGMGGGINGSGSLTVNDSTLSGNTAVDGGGGIAIFGGMLTVTNSTFSGNAATNGPGGGIYTINGRVTVTNSTFSGNSVAGSSSNGGGISSESAPVTVTNSTLSGNSAEETGGGIFSTGAAGFATLASTIVAGNTAALGPDLYPVIESSGYNVIGSTRDAGGFIGTDQQNVDPKLDPAGPRNHGGPTPTIALLPNSPAIDLIPASANCPVTDQPTDQRGTARPQPSGGNCDSGAFEYVPVAPTLASPHIFGPAAGGIVTFGGSGFQTGTALTLGGGAPIVASSVAADGSSFTVTVPAHIPGDVAAVITNPGGLQVSGTFTYSAASLVSIAIAPAGATARAKGQTQQYTATGTFSDTSTQNLTSSVTWASDTPGVATIANTLGMNGLATVVGTSGSTAITASLNGITSNTATLTATPAALVSIAVTPASAAIANGTAQQFTATGAYSDQTTQDLTASVTWASGNTGVATIANTSGSNGLATAKSAGSTQITATSGSVTSPAVTLTVTGAVVTHLAITPANATIAKGTSQQFVAMATYSDDTAQDVTSSAVFTSSDPAVAGIANAPGTYGLATGQGVGTATIRATYGGQTSNDASLTITAATLASLTVTPTNPIARVSDAVPFTAKGTFSDGTTQDVTAQVQWRSSDASVASVDATGKAAAMAPGVTTITATLNGVTGQTQLTVFPPLPVGAIPPAPTPRLPAGSGANSPAPPPAPPAR